MSIKLLSGITEIPFKQSMFPDGGNYVKIDKARIGILGEFDWRNFITTFIPNGTLTINWVFNGDGEFIQLALLVDAIRRLNKEVKINLNLPYFPGARQDRVCEPGEAFNCKVYAKLLQTLNFNQITCFDPHSDVVYAVLDEYNVKLIDNSEFVKEAIRTYLGYPKHFNLNQLITVISPDAGANKKIFKLVKKLPWNKIEVIRADKERNTITHEVNGVVVYGDVEGKTVFIIDDIITGGSSFINLAKRLKEMKAARVILVVSHCEGVAFNKIDKLKDAGLDNIYFHTNLGDDNYDNKFFIQVK